jgi:hypothetical protein
VAPYGGPPCVRADICLPRLNKVCPNPSKWLGSLGIRVPRPGYRVSALVLACSLKTHVDSIHLLIGRPTPGSH